MIKTEKLSYTYAESFSLHNLSLQIKKGEIVGIIGHSGSGKSTLLHLLAGLKEPLSGRVLLDNEVLKTPSKKLVPGHEKIKLVTQQNTLFPNISIAENIAYELRYYEKSYQAARVTKLAKDFNIKHLLSKLPRELSGGEVQRVMIAKALADEPWVLLLDEPMANLDRIHKKQIMLNLVQVLEKEQIACAMVTHDIFDAFGMAHRLMIMQKGRFVQKGTSHEIYFNPKNRYVAELTGELNQMDNFYFRPEHAEIIKAGEYKGMVLGSVFQGAYYDIIIEISENHTITIQHSETIEKGEEVNFQVISFIHFD